MKRSKGFTLIELLVVISIIALLSSVVMVAVKDAREKAQLTKAKQEMDEFVKALEIYKTTYGYYPAKNATTPIYFWWNSFMPGMSVDDFTIPITNELKAKKIYNGDLVNTVKSALKSYSSITIIYESPYLNGGWLNPNLCDGKNFLGKDMVIQVSLDDKNSNIIDFSSSYWKTLTWSDGTVVGNCYVAE